MKNMHNMEKPWLSKVFFSYSWVFFSYSWVYFSYFWVWFHECENHTQEYYKRVLRTHPNFFVFMYIRLQMLKSHSWVFKSHIRGIHKCGFNTYKCLFHTNENKNHTHIWKVYSWVSKSYFICLNQTHICFDYCELKYKIKFIEI
jgi:hypothetical protein